MTFKTIRMKPVLDELLLTPDMTWQARLEASCAANRAKQNTPHSLASRKGWQTRRARRG